MRPLFVLCILSLASSAIAAPEYVETTLTKLRKSLPQGNCSDDALPTNGLHCMSAAANFCQREHAPYQGGIVQQMNHKDDIAHVLCLEGQRVKVALSKLEEFGDGLCRGKTWTIRHSLSCAMAASHYCRDEVRKPTGYFQQYDAQKGQAVVLCTDGLEHLQVPGPRLEKIAFGSEGICRDLAGKNKWHVWSWLHCNSAASNYCRKQIQGSRGGGIVGAGGLYTEDEFHVLCH